MRGRERVRDGERKRGRGGSERKKVHGIERERGGVERGKRVRIF